MAGKKSIMRKLFILAKPFRDMFIAWRKTVTPVIRKLPRKLKDCRVTEVRLVNEAPVVTGSKTTYLKKKKNIS